MGHRRPAPEPQPLRRQPKHLPTAIDTPARSANVDRRESGYCRPGVRTPVGDAFATGRESPPAAVLRAPARGGWSGPYAEVRILRRETLSAPPPKRCTTPQPAGGVSPVTAVSALCGTGFRLQRRPAGKAGPRAGDISNHCTGPPPQQRSRKWSAPYRAHRKSLPSRISDDSLTGFAPQTRSGLRRRPARSAGTSGPGSAPARPQPTGSRSRRPAAGAGARRPGPDSGPRGASEPGMS